MGGGSSINGQMANRGAPTDYDEWEARGAAGWGWKDVLPYFQKVERDLDFDGPLHGKDGRIPVRRIPQAQWTRHRARRGEGLQAAGYKFLPDQNGEFVDGYFRGDALQCSRAARLGRDRLSRSRCAQARQPDDQRPRRRSSELLFEGARCVGVAGARRRQGACIPRPRGRALLTGAIHSPAHLLRAGIGPAGHLKDMGIRGRRGWRASASA